MAERRQRLNQNQLHLIDKVRLTSRQRADEALLRAALSSAQMDELEQARTKLETARLVINCNFKEEIFFGIPLVQSLLRSRRMYNLFEIDYVARDINPGRIRSRLMSEFKIYGATSDIQLVLSRMSNTEHPNYAALDYIGDPIVFTSPAHYGWYRFRLESEPKSRSTFTPADSFVVEREQVFVWEDIDGVLASRTGSEQRFWFEYVNDGVEPFNPDGSVAYIEAQTLGGVFIEDDVDQLYHPETDQFDVPFYESLQELAYICNFDLIPY